MKVLCIANRGSNLSAKNFEEGNTSSTELDLEIGKEYVVYAINLWKGLLGYLIVGEGMYPAWYPAELFNVTRNEIPNDWYFARFSEEQGFDLYAVWGYDNLVNTEDHYDELANLEKKAIDVFVERMKEINEIS